MRKKGLVSLSRNSSYVRKLDIKRDGVPSGGDGAGAGKSVTYDVGADLLAGDLVVDDHLE